MSERQLSRREFVTTSSAAAMGALIVPRHVLGGPGYRAPSDTVNVAVIGMGQQGTENIESLIEHGANLVAVADVDFGFVERTVVKKKTDNANKERPLGVKLNEQFGRAVRYADFRELLEKQKDADAVVIATPDHLHAIIAKTALQLGKHVYLQKPLTYTVREARVLRHAAHQARVVTQMGNQGHSSKEARLINEWIQSGVIGPVTEVNIWTNRPIWPQGLARPALPAPPPETSQPAAAPSWNRGAISTRTAAALYGDYPVPDGMNWQLYLGPVPEDIPYHPIYHPFNWRGWVPFGVGALGDMGAHLVDHPYWALQLGYPTTIEAASTPWGGPRGNPASYPIAMTAHYEFPARGAQPPVVLHWYDGGLMPKRPPQLPDTVQLNGEGGVIYIGERGILMHETYGRNPKVYPESLMPAVADAPIAPGAPVAAASPAQPAPRPEGAHFRNFLNAIAGTEQASSPFDYAAPLTEVMLLGIAALRAGQGKKLTYDAEAMQFTNAPDANQYLTREYRPGWEV
jgi:predicted dehydrogenase